MTEEEAKKRAEEARKRVKAKPTEKEKPVLARLEAKATAPTEKELEKQKRKSDKEALKKLPKEERAVEKAKLKLEEAKKKLEEAKKKNNAKAIEKAQKGVEKAKKDLEKAKKALREKNKLGLNKIAKKMLDNEDKMKKAGMDKDPKKGKDDKGKGKEDEKSKEKQKEAEMQKKYQHIKLPEGMEIRQEGPSWKLYNKQGQSKDVTAEMEALIKTNKAIDAANTQIDKNNKLNMGANAKMAANANETPVRGKGQTNEMVDNSAMGISTGQMKVANPDTGMSDVPASVPEVKITDIDGKALSPDVAKGIAIVSVARAFDEKDLERLKDKDKKHQKEGDEQKRAQVLQKAKEAAGR